MKTLNLFAATSALALAGVLALPAHATDPDAALAAMKTQVFSDRPERREGVARLRACRSRPTSSPR